MRVQPVAQLSSSQQSFCAAPPKRSTDWQDVAQLHLRERNEEERVNEKEKKKVNEKARKREGE